MGKTVLTFSSSSRDFRGFFLSLFCVLYSKNENWQAFCRLLKNRFCWLFFRRFFAALNA